MDCPKITYDTALAKQWIRNNNRELLANYLKNFVNLNFEIAWELLPPIKQYAPRFAKQVLENVNSFLLTKYELTKIFQNILEDRNTSYLVFQLLREKKTFGKEVAFALYNIRDYRSLFNGIFDENNPFELEDSEKLEYLYNILSNEEEFVSDLIYFKLGKKSNLKLSQKFNKLIFDYVKSQEKEVSEKMLFELVEKLQFLDKLGIYEVKLLCRFCYSDKVIKNIKLFDNDLMFEIAKIIHPQSLLENLDCFPDIDEDFLFTTMVNFPWYGFNNVRKYIGKKPNKGEWNRRLVEWVLANHKKVWHRDHWVFLSKLLI